MRSVSKLWKNPKLKIVELWASRPHPTFVTIFFPAHPGHGTGCPVPGCSAGTPLSPSVRVATVIGHGTHPRPRHAGHIFSSTSPTSRSTGP